MRADSAATINFEGVRNETYIGNILYSPTRRPRNESRNSSKRWLRRTGATLAFRVVSHNDIPDGSESCDGKKGEGRIGGRNFGSAHKRAGPHAAAVRHDRLP